MSTHTFNKTIHYVTIEVGQSEGSKPQSQQFVNETHSPNKHFLSEETQY